MFSGDRSNNSKLCAAAWTLTINRPHLFGHTIGQFNCHSHWWHLLFARQCRWKKFFFKHFSRMEFEFLFLWHNRSYLDVCILFVGFGYAREKSIREERWKRISKCISSQTNNWKQNRQNNNAMVKNINKSYRHHVKFMLPLLQLGLVFVFDTNTVVCTRRSQIWC